MDIPHTALNVNSNIQTVLVSGLWDTTDPSVGLTFNAPIYVDFIPDVIILKHFAFLADITMTEWTYKVITNLVPQSDLLSFPVALNYDGGGLPVITSVMQKSDNIFLNKSKVPIRGNYFFQLVPIPNLDPVDVTAPVTFTFQFIKY